MAADKIIDTLLDALKQALAVPCEHRLFRSGKLPGLFPSRAGVHAEGAARALRDGLLEVVRTEAKGKTVIEWVRLTPHGTEFVNEQESAVRALDELKRELKATQDGVPAWLAELRRDVQNFGNRLTEEVQRVMTRLDGLTRRVEETLRRMETSVPSLPAGMETEVPWVHDALAYLDHRKSAQAPGECPLPELFEALARERPDFSVTAFHEGLRRLQERRAARLLPFEANPAELPQPEYALPDGARLYYYLARS